MDPSEILATLRRIYVDGVRAWDESYEAFLAELHGRVGCLSVKLAKVSGSTLVINAPTGDVHYYSFEMPLLAPPDRFRISREAIEDAEGEAFYLVAYCSTILPLTELRWHVHTLDGEGDPTQTTYDVLDEAWLSTHPREADLALRVVEAAEACGWQVIGPDLTEQAAPKDWPWPLPSYDYQDGEYLIRDYILKGVRDY